MTEPLKGGTSGGLEADLVMGGLEADLVVSRPDGFNLDVSLSVNAGETLALLGPNGAGKSTVLETIAGIVAIDRGRIELGRAALDDPDRQLFVPPELRNIGVVFQDYLLFDHLSVLDNVAFGLRSRLRTGSNLRGSAGRRAARQEAERWLAAVGLDGFGPRKPRELSGGQAQRVAVARAMAGGPDLLLLDEPLAAVDVSARTELRRTLADHLADFAGPRLLITHDPIDALILADRMAVIEDGRITQHGAPADLRRRPATPYVAALAGTNLMLGVSRGGVIRLDQSEFELRTADGHDGPVQAVIHPRSISLHRDRPEGSPRNSWRSTIAWIEPLGETTRIQLADPLPIMVDITPASAEALKLAPGSEIWAAVKATEVTVSPV